MLKSQEMRRLAPELDPLRLGTGWRPEDLSKPQIYIASTFGDSHPGSGHLDKLAEAVREGAARAGGHGARYFCTDMCDGESQGTDGINFSLASREMIANMIEIQARATPFDAGVYIASCDKGMPGSLMGLFRVNIPAVVVTGGTMAAGPGLLTEEANRARGLSLTRQDIIRPWDQPLGTDGSIAVLRGNLAPEGAVIKHTACPREMFSAVLSARPFDCEEDCIDAVLHHKVRPGDAVFIRYEGPKGSGMPEMFYTSEAISSDRELGRPIALITDGRFSGASTGPVVGHCSPEAQAGGPIALVEEGDLIRLDVRERVLAIVGVKGEPKTPEEMEAILAERKKRWKPKPAKYRRGVLRLFSEMAASPMKGAYLDYQD